MFTWGEQQEMAFNMLKQAMSDKCGDGTELPHEEHTDANTVAVGGVLLQHHSQVKSCIIHHKTMVLAIPQHKHTIGVMECMAIVLAPHKLCTFVDSTHFTIISDHHALHFVKSKHTHYHY